ncbi:MAG: hypothetical protein GWN16_11725, partial [Calditrichae bacterium]|nr:hypothetical protein [Calditrichia bacterium]NIW80075.1 hypothetical protein [Calditrichia bacterium]
MFSKKHNHLLIIFYVVFLCILSTTAFSQTGTSVYYKNFAHHNDGELCMHTPPEATFTAYLNRDQSQILLENAPRWDNGEPNIAGNGTFGVELGNFNNPPLVVGDSVFVR